jgi:hypothetical protein
MAGPQACTSCAAAHWPAQCARAVRVRGPVCGQPVCTVHTPPPPAALEPHWPAATRTSGGSDTALERLTRPPPPPPPTAAAAATPCGAVLGVPRRCLGAPRPGGMVAVGVAAEAAEEEEVVVGGGGSGPTQSLASAARPGGGGDDDVVGVIYPRPLRLNIS